VVTRSSAFPQRGSAAVVPGTVGPRSMIQVGVRHHGLGDVAEADVIETDVAKRSTIFGAQPETTEGTVDFRVMHFWVLYTVTGPKGPLTCGNTVAEVGLEPHSSPCKLWELQKTCAIRAGPANVRLDPQPRVCTMCTPFFCPFRCPIRRLGRPYGPEFTDYCSSTQSPTLSSRTTHGGLFSTTMTSQNATAQRETRNSWLRPERRNVRIAR
jgi:hypothetical protein